MPQSYSLVQNTVDWPVSCKHRFNPLAFSFRCSFLHLSGDDQTSFGHPQISHINQSVKSRRGQLTAVRAGIHPNALIKKHSKINVEHTLLAFGCAGLNFDLASSVEKKAELDELRLEQRASAQRSEKNRE